MLSVLRIHRLAIIESLELQLGPGFNVLTGETGAGKSILIRSLELVLGGRASPEWIRTGCDTAEVEALFVFDQPFSLPGTELVDLDELVIRRVITRQGRSRAYLNGRLTTLSALRSIAHHLVDISSQHAYHTLADPKSHLGFLDAWGQHDALLSAVRESFKHAATLNKQMQAFISELSDRDERLDLMRFQAHEIDRVDPQVGELAELEAESHRLANADQLAEHSAQIEYLLYGADTAVCGSLARAYSTLEELVQLDPTLTPLLEQLDSAREEVEDVAQSIGRYGRTQDADPHRLADVDERIRQLRRLIRRHGSLEAVIAARQQLQTDLNRLDDAELTLETLRTQAEAAAAETLVAAEALSTARHQAAGSLGELITSELNSLGMGQARVEVSIQPIDGEGIVLGDSRVTATGVDHVEFQIAPNRGEAPQPLSKIASGGELSRSLLAIKRVLADTGPVGLYVFDEIDTGVGGAISEVIAQKLAGVAEHHQVLCITHAPQIAAYGEVHFRVSKHVHEERTHSRLTLLDGPGQVDELSRMLGGIHITEGTRQAARDLLTGARQ